MQPKRRVPRRRAAAAVCSCRCEGLLGSITNVTSTVYDREQVGSHSRARACVWLGSGQWVVCPVDGVGDAGPWRVGGGSDGMVLTRAAREAMWF